MTTPIHYEIHGKGTRDIVICNGLSQSTANWRGIARQNPQFRWILFDARGHGKSLVRKRPYCLDDHVEDLHFVLNHVDLQGKPLVMGFSHGARVALRAAALHPEWFSGLALVSCGSELNARRRAYVTSWEQCLKIGGVRGMAWASLPSIVGNKILEKFPDIEFLIRGSISRNNEEGLLAMFEGMATYPPPKDDALQVTLPTFVLHGGEDPLVVESDVVNFNNWIENCVSQTFSDCGHTLPLEEPARFIKAITVFMDDYLN